MDDFVEVMEAALPDGWSLYDPDMAPDCLLECLHGNIIELDGRCPNGCVSPLIDLGLI